MDVFNDNNVNAVSVDHQFEKPERENKDILAGRVKAFPKVQGSNQNLEMNKLPIINHQQIVVEKESILP